MDSKKDTLAVFLLVSIFQITLDVYIEGPAPLCWYNMMMESSLCQGITGRATRWSLIFFLLICCCHCLGWRGFFWCSLLFTFVRRFGALGRSSFVFFYWRVTLFSFF